MNKWNAERATSSNERMRKCLVSWNGKFGEKWFSSLWIYVLTFNIEHLFMIIISGADPKDSESAYCSEAVTISDFFFFFWK